MPRLHITCASISYVSHVMWGSISRVVSLSCEAHHVTIPMTSWEQSPTQMSRAVQPCTPPRRKRVHSENGQATHSKESPNGSSPQSTPHSVKRRMLSRTQSLGTPDRSGSPFVSTIPKFYSLDATQSPGAGSSSTRASPTGDDNVQSNGIPSGSPCNSSMVRLQRPSTPVSVGDAIRRATYRDQLHLAQHTAPELIADAAIDSEQSVEGVVSQHVRRTRLMRAGTESPPVTFGPSFIGRQ